MDAIQRAKLIVVKKHWMQIGKKRERERIIQVFQDYGERSYISQTTFNEILSMIKGEPNG